MLEPALSILGIDQPLSTIKPTTIHLVDLHKKGIVGARISLNGQSVGEFSRIESGVTLDLSGFAPGAYRMKVTGLSANGTETGADSFRVELIDRVSSPPIAAAPTLNDFVLRSAYYGANGQFADVRAKVASILTSSTIVPAGRLFGDPAPNVHKGLVINYTLRGKPGTLTCQEGGSIDIVNALPPPPGEAPAPVQVGVETDRIQINSATYEGKDVTLTIRDILARGDYVVTVDAAVLGIQDPAPGTRKTMTINLVDIHRVRRKLTGQDGQTIWLTYEPPMLFDQVSNGSFCSQETPGMLSELRYAPPDNGELGQEGIYTVAYRLMRPLQLRNEYRLDFVRNTRTNNSMAMFIHPRSGRQPILLWAERVKVQPNTNYDVECYMADISETTPTSFAPITLQVDQVSNNPTTFVEIDQWQKVHFAFTTGSKSYVTLKIWRDVLPEFTDSGGLIGLDDVSLNVVPPRL